MESKQRSKLAGMAQSLQPIFQIGRNGVTDVVVKELDAALEARELIKLNVLKNSGLDAKEVLDTLAERLSADPISVVGAKIALYRKSKDKA